MQSSARPADVLFFRCGPCGTELSVPLALQGIEGPCPCCGQHIKAPAYIPPAAPRMVHLPPLDLRHETAAIPVKSSPSLTWENHPVGPDLSVNLKLPDPVPSPPEDSGELSPSPRLLPRQLASHGAQSFQAKLAIVSPEEGPDGAGQERNAEAIRRKSATKKGTGRHVAFFDSPLFRIFRVALLVTTGGLFAGLVLYLKDRNWVLDLPWRPAPVETVVEVPLTGPAVTSRPAELEKPFLGEDPSELNGIFDPSTLAPLPEATAIPVGASPIAGSKK